MIMFAENDIGQVNRNNTDNYANRTKRLDTFLSIAF